MASLGSAAIGVNPSPIGITTDLRPGSGFRMDTGVGLAQTITASTGGTVVPTAGITWPRTR